MANKNKTQKAAVKNHVPSLAAVLGIEPAVQFELAGRTFEARRTNFSEQMQLGATVNDENALQAQAEVLTGMLNRRLIDGEHITFEEVTDNLDMHMADQLLRLLHGQRGPAVDPAGK